MVFENYQNCNTNIKFKKKVNKFSSMTIWVRKAKFAYYEKRNLYLTLIISFVTH